MKWISVEERVPDADVEVLFFGRLLEYPFDETAKSTPKMELGTKWEDGSYATGYYGELSEESITHWMPLPAAPAEEGL